MMVFSFNSSAKTLHFICPGELNLYDSNLKFLEKYPYDSYIEVNLDDQLISFPFLDKNKTATLRITHDFYHGHVQFSIKRGNFVVNYAHVNINRITGEMLIHFDVGGLNHGKVYASGTCELAKQKF